MGPSLPESSPIPRALDVIRQIKDADIQAFEELVIKRRREVFKQLTGEEKIALVSLHKMPPSLIEELIRIQLQGIRILGLHDLSNFVWSLHILTEDNRYQLLCKMITEVKETKNKSE
ncbi:MAG: hypothetical protein AB7J40_03290 [Candidatus Altimarinota bacterium]